MDYRRTKYCPELIDVSQKKKEVEKLVEIEHPNAKDMHRYIVIIVRNLSWNLLKHIMGNVHIVELQLI